MRVVPTWVKLRRLFPGRAESCFGVDPDPNGLSLCKIHHAAFDSNILEIRPNDLTLEIREDILREVDGPMLKHRLQDHHGGQLSVPRAAHERPDKERLEMRYDEFRKAS